MGCGAAGSGRRFRAYTLVAIVVVLVVGGWSTTAIAAIGTGLATPWTGVIERAFWYGYQSLFAVFAMKLLAEAPDSADIAADRHRGLAV